MFKKISGLGLPMLVLLPVVGFITSLFDIRSRSSAITYVGFAMLFGYAISFSDESADSYRYATAFSNFDNTLDYNTIVSMYRNGELRDLYRVLLFYFTSLFTQNPKVMYAFAGMVYGILSYKSLCIFVNEYKVKLDPYVFILALVFFTYASLANINGFRFWTGGLVFFYFTYTYIVERKNIFFLGILLAPFFHYGFVLIMPVIIIYKLIERFLYYSTNVNSILFYVFVLTFFASWILNTNSINLGFLTQSDALSGAIGSRLDYVNSSGVATLVETRKDNSLFLNVQKYFDYGIKIYVFVTILYLHKLLSRMTGNKLAYTRLFAFVLFFYAFAFIATSFPSGARFLNIAHLFFIILVGKFYAIYQGKNLKTLILFSLPVFSFNIAFINGMLPLLILSPTFWYGNVFWILIEGWDFIP